MKRSWALIAVSTALILCMSFVVSEAAQKQAETGQALTQDDMMMTLPLLMPGESHHGPNFIPLGLIWLINIPCWYLDLICYYMHVIASLLKR